MFRARLVGARPTCLFVRARVMQDRRQRNDLNGLNYLNCLNGLNGLNEWRP